MYMYDVLVNENVFIFKLGDKLKMTEKCNGQIAAVIDFVRLWDDLLPTFKMEENGLHNLIEAAQKFFFFSEQKFHSNLRHSIIGE